MIDLICKKIGEQKSIEVEEAKWLFVSASRAQLADLSTQVKCRYHSEKKATYLVMSIINFTNICVAACDYCSFYVFPHQKNGYFLSFNEVCKRIERLQSFGGTLVSFNSGFNPKVSIWDYAKLFEKIHKKFPDHSFYEMTVAEFIFNCKRAKITYQKGAEVLKDAGVRWITGGGAEVLSPSFRSRHSPGKYTVDEYFYAQGVLIESNLATTATMVIGFDETLEERFDHLERLRRFQDEHQGRIPSFLCWTYKPFHNKLGGKEISSKEYQRWFAVCRIYLDNFKHMRTSILTQNEEGFDALSFGANDFDLPVEDEVTLKAGATISHNFEALLTKCTNKGFEPIKREPFRLI